jgi:hypothetical protein
MSRHSSGDPAPSFGPVAGGPATAANTQAPRARLPVRRQEARVGMHRHQCLPVRWPAKRLWSACTSAITSTRSRPCSARQRSRSRASIFAGVTGNPNAFRSTAVAFKDLATAAYKAQAPLIQYRQTTNHRGRCAAASPRCRSQGRPSRPAPKVCRGELAVGDDDVRRALGGPRRNLPDRGAFQLRRAPSNRRSQHRRPARNVGGVGQRHRPAGSEADGSAVSGSPPYVDVSPTRGAPSGGVRARANGRGWEEISAAATALITSPPTSNTGRPEPSRPRAMASP